jgi:acetyltransferase-like isoleucine patch superfamily enzyme
MFQKIKKLKGERFAKTIRSYDNGIFDIHNLPEIVRHAGEEAEPLLQYLISLKNIKIENKSSESIKDLLDKAGYDFIIVTDQKSQDSIKKYYATGEVICTIGTDRWKHYHMIQVWKKNIAEIKRENYPSPKREDEYGTSCMSIQIGKSGGFISIKNRYNHTVSNPDNTLSSNPDNIIIGLADALRRKFKVDFSSQKAEIQGNFTIFDKKIVKYNYEINGVFIGENCYIKNGELIEIDKNTQLIMDYFLLDIPSKKIINIVGTEDCFDKILEKELENKKIIITNDCNYQEKPDEFAIIKERK